MAAWKSWLNRKAPDREVHRPPSGVEMVRQQLLAVLDDCEGFECDRLRWRVHTAERPQELWLLRNAVFQVVATQHCQLQAAERINRLVPAFQSILPERMLTRV